MADEQQQGWGQWIQDKAIAGAQAIGDITDSLLYEVNDNSLMQKEYDFTYRTFPADLGTSYNGHYMVININVPVKLGSQSTPTQRTGINTAYINKLLNDDFSKVDVLRYSENINNPGGPNAIQRASISVPRYTRRIRESIALFMPESAYNFTSANSYEPISLTPLIGGIIASGVQGVGNVISDAAGALGYNNVATVAGGLGAGIKNNTTSLLTEGGSLNQAARVFGTPINPSVEVLFANTYQRQFSFTFLLGPRNLKESQTMKEIITTLRYYAAPELGAPLGLFWIPPAEFDITFYHQGVENTSMPRISTCVLNQIDVNYAPQGPFATFSNGHPVAAMVTLQFTEIEVVHKLRVLQGF